MIISETAMKAWATLPSETKQMFQSVASKPSSDMSAFEWFQHLVPSSLQDNPEEIEVFMNGGTVTKEVWVHDQGIASGHYEQVSFEVPDKDVSRFVSGQNGGEYTADNTVMEDMSSNRSRGGQDMSTEELSEINEMNAFEADIIDGSDMLVETSADAAVEATDIIATADTAFEASDIAGVATDLLSDAIAPAIGAYTVGKFVADKCDTTTDKVGFGSLAAGAGALVCMTPVGQAGLALYCGCRIAAKINDRWGKQIGQWWNSPVPWATN